MRERKIGICKMAHNSSSSSRSVCFWVLAFLFFSFLCLTKAHERQRAPIPLSSPFIPSPLPSLLPDPTQIFALSPFQKPYFFLSLNSKRFSSVPYQIQGFAKC